MALSLNFSSVDWVWGAGLGPENERVNPSSVLTLASLTGGSSGVFRREANETRYR